MFSAPTLRICLALCTLLPALGCVEGAWDDDGSELRTASQPLGAWSQETVAGVQVWLYTPESPPALDGQRALMVSLHGCAQQSTALKDHGNWEAAAESHGMVVAVPSVPNGGVIFGCWDYYGANHTRDNKHNGPLLDLVDALLDRPDLNLDARQVYISGLSSGSTQAMVVGCLAPDVFAGVGLNAGPTLGTSASDTTFVATNEAQASALCRQLAGPAAGSLDTQIASIIHGDNDFTVNTGYNRLSADVLASLYGASGPETFATEGLPGTRTDGQGWLWSDADGPRVSLIENTGLGHNWPAGQGGFGGAFVNKDSLDYPAILTRFLFENNRRVDGAGPIPEPDPTPDAEPTPAPDADPNPTPEPAPTPEPGMPGQPDSSPEPFTPGPDTPQPDGGGAEQEPDGPGPPIVIDNGCASTGSPLGGDVPSWMLLGLVVLWRLRR